MWQRSFSIMINNFIMITSQFSSSSMCHEAGWKRFWEYNRVKLSELLYSNCLETIYWFSSPFTANNFRHFIILNGKKYQTMIQFATQKIMNIYLDNSASCYMVFSKLSRQWMKTNECLWINDRVNTAGRKLRDSHKIERYTIGKEWIKGI